MMSTSATRKHDEKLASVLSYSKSLISFIAGLLNMQYSSCYHTMLPSTVMDPKFKCISVTWLNTMNHSFILVLVFSRHDLHVVSWAMVSSIHNDVAFVEINDVISEDSIFNLRIYCTWPAGATTNKSKMIFWLILLTRFDMPVLKSYHFSSKRSALFSVLTENHY